MKKVILVLLMFTVGSCAAAYLASYVDPKDVKKTTKVVKKYLTKSDNPTADKKGKK